MNKQVTGCIIGILVGLCFILSGKFLEKVIPLLSAMAAMGSCYVAWQVRETNNKQSEAKLRSDLYCLVIQLSSLEHYLQSLYELHDIDTEKDTFLIMNNIKNINKNIIDINKEYFYNFKYDEEILISISEFSREYSIWKAYKIISNENIFTEIEYINKVRLSTIKILEKIKNIYFNDYNLLQIIKPILCNIDKVKEQIKNYEQYNDNYGYNYIAGNLHFLFSKVFNYSPAEKECIVNKLFYFYLIYQVCEGRYNREKIMLFKEEITTINDINGIKKFFDTIITDYSLNYSLNLANK